MARQKIEKIEMSKIGDIFPYTCISSTSRVINLSSPVLAIRLDLGKDRCIVTERDLETSNPSSGRIPNVLYGYLRHTGVVNQYYFRPDSDTWGKGST